MELIELYHQALPELPRVNAWSGRNRTAMQARWKWLLTAKRIDGTRYAESAEQAMTKMEQFFVKVSESDWLMGRSKGGWQCPGLGWLVQASAFEKVINNEFRNREVA